MTNELMDDYNTSPLDGGSRRGKSGGGWMWLWLPFILILFGGLTLSAVAFQVEDLTIAEALTAGFVGVGGLIVGLIGGLIGLAIGLIGAAIGLIAAGGVLAITFFVLGSPIIAIVLLFLLLRRSKECPDPSVHGEYDA